MFPYRGEPIAKEVESQRFTQSTSLEKNGSGSTFVSTQLESTFVLKTAVNSEKLHDGDLVSHQVVTSLPRQ